MTALRISTIVAATIALGLASGTALGRDIYVPGTYPNIQAAINAARTGDVIILTEAQYTGPGNRDINFNNKAITVRSDSGNPNQCVINCQGSATDPHRGFTFDSGESSASVLRGVTIKNGYVIDGHPWWSGAGIYIDDSCPTIEDCIITNNFATSGGGGMRIYNNNSACSPAITDCVFSNNRTDENGGGITFDMANATLENCRFDNNSAGYGGGICIRNPRDRVVSLTGCTFSGNSVDRTWGSGGGAHVEVQENFGQEFTDCIFSNNWAAYGGGVYISGNDHNADIQNCTFCGNGAHEAGAGVYIYWGNVDLMNTIIAFSVQGEAVIGCPWHMWCCDIYQNAGGDYVGCIEGMEGMNENFSEDPLFCDAANADFTLHEDSPCLRACFEEDMIGALGQGCGPLGPMIRDHPDSAEVCEGESVTFTVLAEGEGTLSYQWYHDGSPVGPNDDEYTIPAATPDHAGYYWVVVTNDHGEATSDSALLTVYTAPAITDDPDDLTVVVGGTATFSVTASGSEPLEYRWYKDNDPNPLENGGRISGATTHELTINPVEEADAGFYKAEVSNDCGSDQSIPAELTVEEDCNGNGISDRDDVDPTDPDGNGEVSADCQLNGVPDECESAKWIWSDPDPNAVGSYTDPGNWDPNDPDVAGPFVPTAHAWLRNTADTPNMALLNDPQLQTLCSLTIGATGIGPQTLEVANGVASGADLTASEQADIEAGGILQLALGSEVDVSGLVTNAGRIELEQATLESGDELTNDHQLRMSAVMPGISILRATNTIINNGELCVVSGVAQFETPLFENNGDVNVATGAVAQIIGGVRNGNAFNLNTACTFGFGGGWGEPATLTVFGDLHAETAASLLGRTGLLRVWGDLDLAIDDPSRFDFSAGRVELIGLTQELEMMAADEGDIVNPADPARFGIGEVRLGPSATTVTLVDNHDNSGSGGNESLYVGHLNLEPGVTLDVAGAIVYYQEVTPDDPMDPNSGVTIEDSVGGGGLVPIDCNGNDIPDHQDRDDCDGSPWCSDCNGNGVLDGCDIAYGNSTDTNGNGIPDECECIGDLDHDYDVDLADLAQLLSNYGMTSGAEYEDGDLDGDGDVDLADLAALLAVYGTTCPGPPDWSDDFDSYELGSGMHGQGGWKGWDNDPDFDAFVTNAQARSTPHAVDIVANADLVHEFSGYTVWQWTFTAWQFVPGDFVGRSYFVLLNTYNDGGPYNWSTSVIADGANGVVESEYEGATLPLITDRWVELRVEIDLDADSQTIYYDDQVLSTKSWTGGMPPAGVLNIAAVDLYANGSSSVYYDDVSLRAQQAPQ